MYMNFVIFTQELGFIMIQAPLKYQFTVVTYQISIFYFFVMIFIHSFIHPCKVTLHTLHTIDYRLSSIPPYKYSSKIRLKNVLQNVLPPRIKSRLRAESFQSFKVKVTWQCPGGFWPLLVTISLAEKSKFRPFSN